MLYSPHVSTLRVAENTELYPRPGFALASSFEVVTLHSPHLQVPLTAALRVSIPRWFLPPQNAAKWDSSTPLQLCPRGPATPASVALWLKDLPWGEKQGLPPLSLALYRVIFALGLPPLLSNTSWEWLLSIDLISLCLLVLPSRML